MLNRAVIATGRDLARAKAAANALYSPTGTAPADPSSWRGDHGLRAADRILAQARQIVSPDMENGDATVGDGSPEQEMEPLDPTIAPRQAEDDEEDEENQPRDEAGRFSERQDEEDEEEGEDEMAAEAAGVDITIVEVDQENEVGEPEDELV